MPAAQQRQRPDAEIVAGQVSRSSLEWCAVTPCVVKSYLTPRCGETGRRSPWHEMDAARRLYLPASEAKRASNQRPAGDRDLRAGDLVPFEADERAHRHVELAQPGGAAEVGQVDDEAGGEHLRAQLAQQLD